MKRVPSPGSQKEVKAPDTPKPLEAVRRHYLWLCNGSALEVRLCPAKSSPLWGYRFGHKPTAAMIAELGNCQMYPLEDGMAAAKFYERGGTVLKAIKRYCLDCSGGCKSEVRDCTRTTCDLHPNRHGKNPNRKMRPEQSAIRAELLKANIARKKNCDVG